MFPRTLMPGVFAHFRIVLMILLSIVMLQWCSRPVGNLQKSNRVMAMIEEKEIELALRLFSLDVDRFPTTEEGLEALIRNPGNLRRWKGPYLSRMEVPKDPWGRPYLYRNPGRHGNFDLISYGSDGVEGGVGIDADIANR